MLLRTLPIVMLAFVIAPSASAVVLEPIGVDPALPPEVEAALPPEAHDAFAKVLATEGCEWADDPEGCAQEHLEEACLPGSELGELACATAVIECALSQCFDNWICDSPGGYGESLLGPAPGAVGASIGPLNTESPEQGTFGPYTGTGLDTQGC